MSLEVALSLAAIGVLVLLALVLRRYPKASAPMRREDIKEMLSVAGPDLFILLLATLATIAATIFVLLR